MYVISKIITNIRAGHPSIWQGRKNTHTPYTAEAILRKMADC